jgi:hypothetical protein
MNPPLTITVSPGEVIPEYTISLVGGGVPEPGKHYTLETNIDEFGVFTIHINPLSIISVIETDGKEKNVHLFDGTSWIANEGKKKIEESKRKDGGKKKIDDDKKKSVKIEFDEEAPTIDEFGTNADVAEARIKKWVFDERQAMSIAKRADGAFKITAINKDVGPQLKTKLEMFLMERCRGYGIHETVSINREYYIVVGTIKPSEPPKNEGAPEPEGKGEDVLIDIKKKLNDDPEVQMLAKRYSIGWIVEKSCSPSDFWKLKFSAPSIYVREMMALAESVVSSDLVFLMPDNLTLECAVTVRDALVKARPKIFNDVNGGDPDYHYPSYYVVPTDKRRTNDE